jgi:hypothetical protein
VPLHHTCNHTTAIAAPTPPYLLLLFLLLCWLLMGSLGRLARPCRRFSLAGTRCTILLLLLLLLQQRITEHTGHQYVLLEFE